MVVYIFIRNPHKNQHTNSRFEVFNVYVDVSSADFKRGKLFGDIMISDSLGLVPDGWGQIDKPGPGRVTLFDRHWFHAIDITNPGRLTIGNPRSGRSVPFASSMEIGMTLYATTESEDEIFEVCAHHSNDFGFKNFWNMDSKSSCQYIEVGGADGFARMHYILLKDAVDASIKVKYVGSKRKFNAELLAYYGSDFDYGDDALAASFYKASLFESYGKSLVEGDVALIRSCISVPAEGSLIIKARFTDAESRDAVFDGQCEFSSHHKDSFVKHVKKDTKHKKDTKPHKKDVKDQKDVDHLEVIVGWSRG